MLKEILKDHFSFCPDIYLYKYPDIYMAKANPIEHFLIHGKNENRNCSLSSPLKLLRANKIQSPGIVNRFSSDLGYPLIAEILLNKNRLSNDRLRFILENDVWVPLLRDRNLEVIQSSNSLFIIKFLSVNDAIKVDNIEMQKIDDVEYHNGNKIAIYHKKMAIIQNPSKLEIELDCADLKSSYAIKNPFSRILILSDAHHKNDPSRIYRCQLKASQLEQAGITTVIFSEPELASMLESGEISFFSLISYFGCIVFQRLGLSKTIHKILDIRNKIELKLIYDVDDLIFQPWKSKDTAAVKSGLKNENDKDFKESLRSRMRMMLHCDGAITSTSYLKRCIKNMGPDTYVIKNKIEENTFLLGEYHLKRYQPAAPLKIIYMSGSLTHVKDAEIVISTLQKFMEENSKHVQLTVIGDVDKTAWRAIENCEILNKVSRGEMLSILANQDISIVPLEKSEFNIGKSSLKFIEASAVGTLTLASPMYEFKKDISTSGSGGIFRSSKDLTDQLQAYLNDRNLLTHQKNQAFKYALRNYKVAEIENKFFTWLNNI